MKTLQILMVLMVIVMFFQVSDAWKLRYYLYNRVLKGLLGSQASREVVREKTIIVDRCFSFDIVEIVEREEIFRICFGDLYWIRGKVNLDSELAVEVLRIEFGELKGKVFFGHWWLALHVHVKMISKHVWSWRVDLHFESSVSNAQIGLNIVPHIITTILCGQHDWVLFVKSPCNCYLYLSLFCAFRTRS